MSGDRIVYVCTYGRHKPGKVHKEFQYDGRVFVDGREMVLVADESKDEVGRTTVPPHKEIEVGKLFVMGGFEVRLEDVYEGDAVQPPAPEPVSARAKLKPFKAPAVLPGRTHPYAGSSAGNRMVRRGGSYDREEEDRPNLKMERKPASAPLNPGKQLLTAADLEVMQKPVPQKNKYSLFD